MDITTFIISGRNKALLYGDYATYHSQLSRRLLKCRQKLNITSKNRAKFSKKPDVTAQNVQQDIGYLHLLLLTCEVAWAQAMSMKAAHAANTKGITGRNRSHIISRLVKACRTAELMASVVSQAAESPTDILEARAYASLLVGAASFEKQAWEPSLRAYSVSRVIYAALASSSLRADVFKDLLSDTVDPSIRYAAYQLKTPRTVPITTIARENLKRADPELVILINQLDPSNPDSGPGRPAAQQDVPRTLTWRSREVTIEDAAIAQAWNSVGGIKARLEQTFASISNATPPRLAAAYDDILTATQEAVDATKSAIDELREEGVPSNDSRLQALHVTRTAVTFEMISWRIGRNRVLTGAHDGALEELNATRHTKAKPELPPLQEDGEQASPKSREEKPRRKLLRLKEKVALYDGTLHNLDAIKELAGVAADEELSRNLDSFRSYFEALKCLAIGRSHTVVGQPANALALLDHALTLLERMLPALANASVGASEAKGPLNINVSSESAEFLQSVLRGEQQRHCALVLIDKLAGSQQQQAYPRTRLRGPLSDRLGEFPEGGVDLSHIVEHPPRISSAPVKPIFLDIAWNHIEYPKPDGSTNKPTFTGSKESNKEKPAEQAPQKRGWFGFSR